MNTKRFIAAAIVALISVPAVHAEELMLSHKSTSIVKSPTFSWTGLYFGGQIGCFSSEAKMKRFHKEKRSLDREDPVPQLSGLIKGVYVGLNVIGNTLVLGVDADKVWSEQNEKTTWNERGFVPRDIEYIEQIFQDAGKKVDNEFMKAGSVVISSVTLKEDWVAAARIRAGLAFDRIMFYIAGGAAYTKLGGITTISIKEKQGNMGTNKLTFSDETKIMRGYTLGAGIDLAMTNNLIARAEYRYSDFGRTKFVRDIYGISYKTNDFRIGVAYKF